MRRSSTVTKYSDSDSFCAGRSYCFGALPLIAHIENAQAAKWDSFIATQYDDTAKLLRAKRAFYDGQELSTPCEYIRPISDAKWSRFRAIMLESASDDDGYVAYLLAKPGAERQVETEAKAECDAAFNDWRIVGNSA